MKYLIVVDYQKDFVIGKLGSERAKRIFAEIQKKISEYSNNGWKVVFTYDTHYENYMETSEGHKLPVVHCVEGTDGWQLYMDVDQAVNGEPIYVKKNTFGYTEWKSIIPDADEIVIIGVCTDICVVSNALILKALFTEIPISVDASCCAGTSDEAHDAALTTMKSCQIDVYGE